MKIGFIGHNGFALGDPENPVLVDPLLLARFGEEYTSSPVEVYPPRVFDLSAMPTPAAVIISHEHSDHFHLPTLNKLDRSVPIVVGPTMIEAVVRPIARLGFEVIRLPFGVTTRFGSVDVTLYPPDPETVLWESRVSQVYVRDADDAETGGLYLCIDALLSPEFVADVEAGIVPPPQVLAVSNNAQVTPTGVFGSLDNLRAAGQSDGAAQRSPFVALDILRQLLVGYLELNPQVSPNHFIICGGGFLKDYEEMGPFPFSEQKELANIASHLVRRVTVAGPEPGEVLELREARLEPAGDMGWVGTDHERFAELVRRREEFIASDAMIGMRPITPATDGNQELTALAVVTDGLKHLATAVMLAPLGRDLLALSRDNPAAGPCRLVVQLRCDHIESRSYALNVVSGTFEQVPDLPLDDALAMYPYGVIVRAVDFAAVLTGALQIWDIVGIAMRSWYLGDSMNSLVALFYDILGEQLQPDTSCSVYDLQLSAINEGRE
ncbi:MBL fold metallo-hydrolase [Amycolatopsis sp. lyj-109]|uniref:MBL fold metallo-hydrolase n=1 Tax=Amycolatopsis sp. lyj-109 TaxID=2789287 RepID=UPI00397D6D9C